MRSDEIMESLGHALRTGIFQQICRRPLHHAPTVSGNPLHQAAPVSTNTQITASDGALIPRTDLKPLYDFTLDCQACQAKLSVALIKERDAAVEIAKGGTAWHRVTRAAKWFLLGTAAGAIAAKAR